MYGYNHVSRVCFLRFLSIANDARGLNLAVTILLVSLPLVTDCSLFKIFLAAYQSQAWPCNSLWLTHATSQPKAQELSLTLPYLFSF